MCTRLVLSVVCSWLLILILQLLLVKMELLYWKKFPSLMSVDSWDILIKIFSSVICCPTGFKVDTMYWYSRFQHCFRASENLYNILNTHHCSFGYLFDTTSACSFQSFVLLHPSVLLVRLPAFWGWPSFCFVFRLDHINFSHPSFYSDGL